MSSQKLEYSVNLFLCIEEWLPNVALIGLQRLVASVFTKQMRLLAKQLEKGNSVVLRHNSGGELSFKFSESMINLTEFIELHNVSVQILIKVKLSLMQRLQVSSLDWTFFNFAPTT
jgi:hypothetical protein